MKSQVYETVIGLEIHTQILTKSKLFCSCSSEYGNPPNSLTCPVCLGLPGALPVLNQEAVVMAIKFALAVCADINLWSAFSHKNYFYPDLPKGYQITQYHFPIATGGNLDISLNSKKRKLCIERINLEEDAGKSIHDGMIDSDHGTYLDFNRRCVPLLEVVGKPDIHSPTEAVEFLQLLKTTLQYLEICSGNMEEGSLRCDANLSVREKGSQEFQIPPYAIKVLTTSQNLADYFEAAARASKKPKQTSNWIMREVLQDLKEDAIDISCFPISPQDLAELILLVENKKISIRVAKEEIFPEMLKSKKKSSEILKEKKLSQISDESALEEIIIPIVEKNRTLVKKYLEGKVQVQRFFVGQVMRTTRGRSNPEIANKVLKRVLKRYNR